MHQQLNNQLELITKLTKLPPNKELNDRLRHELTRLRQLNDEYQIMINTKKVVHTTSSGTKTRYYLKDGSSYVIGKNYRYLYDANSKSVTYEFDNGQIERTFSNGLKEIRRPDGSIIIRDGPKEYEYLNK